MYFRGTSCIDSLNGWGYLLLWHCHNLPCTKASCPPSNKTRPQCPEIVQTYPSVLESKRLDPSMNIFYWSLIFDNDCFLNNIHQIWRYLTVRLAVLEGMSTPPLFQCIFFYGMSRCSPVSLCRGCTGSNQRGRHALGLASPATWFLYSVKSCLNVWCQSHMEIDG